MLVHRFSIRPCRDELADARDRAEIPKTAVILNGKVRVMATALAAILRSPLRFVRTLRETLRLHAPLSDRGLVAHLAYLAEACVLLGELRRRKIGHLHAHFGTNPAAVALGWRRTDCRIFFVLNLSNTQVNGASVALTGVGAAASGTVFNESSRSVTLSGGKLSDDFAPYALHIYVVQ